MSQQVVRIPTILPWDGQLTALISNERPRGHRAAYVYICSLLYAGCHETGDTLPYVCLRVVGGNKKDAELLVRYGLWEESEKGWILTHNVESGPVRRGVIPEAVRQRCYERDGFACVICGSTDRITLDHVKHFSKGGDDTLPNLRTLCLPCNASRKDKSDYEWLGVGFDGA